MKKTLFSLLAASALVSTAVPANAAQSGDSENLGGGTIIHFLAQSGDSENLGGGTIIHFLVCVSEQLQSGEDFGSASRQCQTTRLEAAPRHR